MATSKEFFAERNEKHFKIIIQTSLEGDPKVQQKMVAVSEIF